MSDSEYEDEEFLVYADFKNHLLPAEITGPNSTVKIIGIESKTPIAEVNGNVFKGSYDYAMGTMVFFDKDNTDVHTDPIYDVDCKQRYKIIGKTNKVINFHRVFVEKNTELMETFKDEEENPIDRNLRVDLSYDTAIKQFPFWQEYQQGMEQMLGEKMSDPINLRNFLQSYKNKIDLVITSNELFDIKTILQLEDETENFKLIVQNCSLEHLEQKSDERITPFIPGLYESSRKIYYSENTPECNLRIVKKLQEFKDNYTHNPFKRTSDIYRLLPVPDAVENGEELKLYNELIITVRIYRPTRVVHAGKKVERPVFAEEFECLGSNFLTEFRDKISCICNKKHFFDISDQPSAENLEKKTDPGFFFITNTFYNDKRNPNNPDYSETIRNWSKNASGLQKLKFLVANMEKTQFYDLNVSLGFPNLYMHHGNCEHVFTFSQIELVTPGSLCKFRQQYPRLRSLSTFNNRLCHMCNQRHFNYVVEDSTRQLHNPTYLCVSCFYSYHYVDGKKVGNFKAYRLYDCTTEEQTISTDNNHNSEDDSADDEFDGSDNSEKKLNESIIIKKETNTS